MIGETLVARDVSVRLGGATIVDRVSLHVEPGEWLAVIGPNGAGKSTLLRAVSGTARFAGRVEIGGRSITSMPSRERARHIAVVAQAPVIPEGITVGEYAALGRTPYAGRFGAARLGDAARVAEVLGELGIIEFAQRPMTTLSGGERQRALLARALVQDTPVLLLDEPTSALDVGHQQDVLELVDRLRRERGLTVLMTIHDLTLASRYADRLLLLVDGREEASGTAGEVLTEDHLSRFYGARVRVLCLEDGIAIVPRRPPHRPRVVRDTPLTDSLIAEDVPT
ncbi:MAG: ABC transporter ATP-binding protein [Ilumatobacteraceae bacterium]